MGLGLQRQLTAECGSQWAARRANERAHNRRARWTARRGAIGWLIASLSLCVVVAGCARFPRKRDSLPAGHTVVRGQLIIYSDFALAKNHRLVEELVAERDHLAETLLLPVSDEPIHVYLFAGADRFQ